MLPSIDGTYHCAIPDAAYCAGDSLSTNIIIRCNGYIGSPGKCNDNLDGEPPFGLSYGACFQTSDVSGDAACTRKRIMLEASGNYNGISTVLPNYVPEATSIISTSSAQNTSYSTTISPIVTPTTTSSSTSITTMTHSNTHSYKHSNTSISTTRVHWIIPTGFREHSSRSTRTSHFTHPTGYHNHTMITLTTAPASASSGSPPKPVSNGTMITSSQSNSGSPTQVPVGPTTTIGPVSFKSAAGANRACAGLVGLGLLFVALL